MNRLPGLGPADAILMVYAAFAGLLFLLMGWKLDAPTHWAAFVVAHGAILALTYWVVTKPRPEGGLLGFVREGYPLFHIGFLYWGLRYLALFFSDGYHDAAIAGVDQALFGESLAMTLCQRFPSMFVSETLHAGYASYWIMVPAASVALYLRGRKEGLRELVFSSLLVFFVCYLFFIFYPVQGPYFAFPRIGEPLSNGAAYRLVHAVLADGASRGAAFPSSHVAVACTILPVAWRHDRTVFAWFLVPVFLLTLGTVYCRIHYAIDAVCGVLLAVLLFPLVLKVRAWLQRRLPS